MIGNMKRKISLNYKIQSPNKNNVVVVIYIKNIINNKSRLFKSYYLIREIKSLRYYSWRH
jgi:hypothetical protein